MSNVKHRQASAAVKGMLTSRARAAFGNSQGPFQKVRQLLKSDYNVRSMFICLWIRVSIKFGFSVSFYLFIEH